jgi:DNA-binding NtrC family response regulator
MTNLLIIDRDPILRKNISQFFDRQAQSVHEAADYDSALRFIEKTVFDVIIADVTPNGGSIQELVQSIRVRQANTALVVYSGIDTLDLAIQAIKEGACSIIQKPFSLPELNIHVEKAIEIRSLKQEAQSLRVERNTIYETENLVGASPAIRKVFDLVTRVAQTSSSVILTGETGTGKELIAGAIHYNSQRAQGPFVRVNCAALPEQLLESELFGYEKGAFTGADKLRLGRFEQADGGTIFLDEIADMSQFTQAKVLRVLQEKEFERLGSNRTVRVDVRLISATNKNLVEEIQQGRFREDLYYRLNVVTIPIPPLREREGDIPLLANFFLHRFSGDLKKKVVGFHPKALQMLTAYHWPGNVRELENTIERSVIMAEGETVLPGDLSFLLKPEPPPCPNSHHIQLPPGGIRLEEVEKSLLMQALERTNWVQKDAADLLGISRRALNYRVQRFGLTHPRWKRYR